jgi:hypothetical protein
MIPAALGSIGIPTLAGSPGLARWCAVGTNRVRSCRYNIEILQHSCDVIGFVLQFFFLDLRTSRSVGARGAQAVAAQRSEQPLIMTTQFSRREAGGVP